MRQYSIDYDSKAFEAFKRHYNIEENAANMKNNVNNEKLEKWALSQLQKNTAEAIKKDRDFMKDPRAHWKDERELLDSWWIKNSFNKRERAKLEAMTYDKILDAYKARRIEEIKKESERTAGEIKAVCASSMPEFIDVTVEWKKNRTWGANPRAEVRTGEKFHESRSIGGRGYDKESTATAECFNKDVGIKKAALVALYKNAHLPKNRRYIRGVNFFHCHAPYFEGGCGFSCHRHVLELAGYKLVNQNGGTNVHHLLFRIDRTIKRRSDNARDRSPRAL